jgi:hypothetical protein
MSSSVRIPLRAHLIWFGSSFPWANVLAVRSAALRGGFEQVVLHHDSDLSATPYYRELIETPGVELRALHVPALLERCAPHSAGLAAIFARLRTPATRSDLVRFALLYCEGGVYLDIDTVTVASFEPLCREPNAFCGQERIVYPASVRASRDPRVRLGALARDAVRDLLRRAPRGFALWKRIESWYALAANPAILASSPRTRFITEAIERMLEIPADQQPRPNVIGPHLLQHMVATYRGSDLAVHAPEVFFPLGPEISEHWFREARHVDLAQVLSPDTRLVHWYGSVRTKHLVPRIDPDYVRAHAQHQLWSALALPFTESRGGDLGMAHGSR